MQLFALDQQSPILASQARKHRNYECPECKGVVRLRGGPHRQAHYYHIRHSPHCRQHQKSQEHIQSQLRILNLLPKGECFLERPFPSLSRIADVVWEKEQIVFEIQCSAISKQEVEERTADYKRAGMRIVWILHDKQFNQKKLSAAENHLRSQTCYYTNVIKPDSGIFYDQFEIIQGAIRKYKGPPLPISLNKPLLCPFRQSPIKTLAQRASQWELFFSGDLLHRLSQAETQSLTSIQAIEERLDQKPKKTTNPLMMLYRLYQLMLEGLIRSCSKK